MRVLFVRFENMTFTDYSDRAPKIHTCSSKIAIV